MKTFSGSQLNRSPEEVYNAAREEGVIIQRKARSGRVLEEFVLVAVDMVEIAMVERLINT